MFYTGTEVHNLPPLKKPDSQMKGKTGEWGEGPAGATVPYDIRGLHAAPGAIWTAPRGDNRSDSQNLKIKPARAPSSQKKRARAPSALGRGPKRTIIVTEPPDMLADVPADFGGCPRRSR